MKEEHPPPYIIFVVVFFFFLTGLGGFLICHLLKKKGYRCHMEDDEEEEEEEEKLGVEEESEFSESSVRPVLCEDLWHVCCSCFNSSQVLCLSVWFFFLALSFVFSKDTQTLTVYTTFFKVHAAQCNTNTLASMSLFLCFR